MLALLDDDELGTVAEHRLTRLDEIHLAGELAGLGVVDDHAGDQLQRLEQEFRSVSIHRFMVSTTTSCGALTWLSSCRCKVGWGIGQEDCAAIGKRSRTLGGASAMTPSCVSSVSATFMSPSNRAIQRKVLLPLRVSKPARSMLRPANTCRHASGKSSPTTPTSRTGRNGQPPTRSTPPSHPRRHPPCRTASPPCPARSSRDQQRHAATSQSPALGRRRGPSPAPASPQARQLPVSRLYPTYRPDTSKMFNKC